MGRKSSIPCHLQGDCRLHECYDEEKKITADNVSLQAFAGGIILENYSAYGSSKLALDELTAAYNFRWYNDDGVIYLTANGVPSVSASASSWTIHQGNGMIGSPTVTDTGMRVLTTLNPGIHLGDKVIVESIVTDERGPYKVVAIEHSGDNWSGEFKTNLFLHDLAVETEQSGIRSLLEK